MKLVNTDLKTHYALLRDKGDFDVARAGWIADYSDPQNFLFLAESDNKGLNYASYSNPEFDALMKKAAATKDLAARGKVLKEAEAIFMRDAALPAAAVLRLEEPCLRQGVGLREQHARPASLPLPELDQAR